MDLPQKYWIERTLREITSVAGKPLLIDNATSKRIFGHYTRVLIDMDFSKIIFHEILVKSAGFSFCVEVAYEWLPDFCSHCQNLGHNVTSCCWLYPRKEGKVSKKIAIKGMKQIPTSKQYWMPIKENPSDVGSSKAFAAPATTEVATYIEKSIVATTTQVSDNSHQMQATHTPVASTTMISIYFSFALQYVSDKIPHMDLPQPTSPVLESREVVDVPKVPDATATFSTPVMHDVVQVISNQLISSTYAREESPVQHDVVHADVQSSPPLDHTLVLSIPVDVDRLSQVIVTHAATSEDGNRVLVVHEEDTHNNSNIQQDMELWSQIHDYDKKAAKIPFTPIFI
jgi:hypothetical protein